jgi:hypothetical protein
MRQAATPCGHAEFDINERPVVIHIMNRQIPYSAGARFGPDCLPVSNKCTISSSPFDFINHISRHSSNVRRWILSISS